GTDSAGRSERHRRRGWTRSDLEQIHGIVNRCGLGQNDACSTREHRADGRQRATSQDAGFTRANQRGVRRRLDQCDFLKASRSPLMKRGFERKTAATILSAALALVAALFFFTSLPVPVDRKLHEKIGTALAVEAASLLRPGGKITVISRDTRAFPQPALDI